MTVLRGSRLAGLAGCTVLTAGLAVSAVTGAGPARAQSAIHPLPTRSAAVSWGYGIFGRLGDGLLDPNGDPAQDRLLPGAMAGLTSGVVAVSAGQFSAMALTSDGRAWTWGSNLFGGLGNGTAGPGTDTALAAPVAGLADIVQVAAGAWSSYALRSDGTVWGWGLNTGTLAPARVPGLTGVTQIAVSRTGFALALRSDGTVWGWGANTDGVLGAGAPSNGTDTPVRVNGLSGVTAIAAGEDMGLAVARRTVHGIPTTLTSVYAWGSDFSGQLGYSVPANQPGQPVPQVVPGLPQVTGIAAGVGDALAIGADGSVWGWGADQYGQLGNSPRPAPELSPVETFAPGSGITQISATNDFTLALRSGGTVLAFGANERGQAGTGTTSPTSTPIQVSGLTGVSQISASYSYGLAVHRVLALSLPAG